MQAPERDWGPVFVRLAAVYGFRPWDVERMSEDQIQMYLEGSGAALLMKALPTLQYSFGKFDDEARQKLIDTADHPPDPNSVGARAWRIFTRNYHTDAEEAEKAVSAERLPISRGAAAAIVAMVETGELTRDYGMGSLFCRTLVMGIWHALIATSVE